MHTGMLNICGYVQTRVLVTHGLSYLPLANLILVMVEGEITEMGSYQQLMDREGAFAEFQRTYTAVDHTDNSGETHRTHTTSIIVYLGCQVEIEILESIYFFLKTRYVIVMLRIMKSAP